MRLIDADALSKVVNADINRCYQLGIGSVGPLSLFLDQINEQPTINPDDLRPHGRWEEIRNDYGELEGWLHVDCGRESKSKDAYCGTCGAKMDGKDVDTHV